MTALATERWARRRQHPASAATSPSLLQQPLRFDHNLGFSLDWCLYGASWGHRKKAVKRQHTVSLLYLDLGWGQCSYSGWDVWHCSEKIMVGNAVELRYPPAKETSNIVSLFLQFAYLADKMNKVCVSVCPSESKWVLMFGLAVFPGMESALSLITTRWCALEAVSVYEAKEELHTALKLHAEFTHLHVLQMPFFFQDEKKKKNAACDGSTRKVSKTMCNPWFASHPLEVLCLVSAEDCAVGLLIAHFKRCDSGLHGPRLTPRNSCGWAAVDMLWLTRNPTLHQTHSK